MDNRRIVYSPRPDTTPETELSTLAAIYRFAVACHLQERGRLPDKSGPDDEKVRSSNDSLASNHSTT